MDCHTQPENTMSKIEMKQHDINECNISDLLKQGIQHHDAGRFEEAVKCFETASNQGDAKGMYDLALCYQKGEGVDKNEKKAFQLLLRASDKGYDEAKFQLAECYYWGKGTKMDRERAQELYLETANLGNRVAQFMVGYYLMWNHGNSFFSTISERDTVKAFEWFMKSAEQGYHPAQRRIGAFYESGTDPCVRNLEKAEYWYLKAAEQGNERALFALGRIYANGIDEVTPDYFKAFEYYLMSAKKGLSVAQYRTGVSYLYGKGVARNTEEAKKWLELAAKQHHRMAEIMLDAMDNDSSEGQTDPMEASYRELAFAEIDECGVLYSQDGKRLLRYSMDELSTTGWNDETSTGDLDVEFGTQKIQSLTDYTVKKGTEIICNNAFSGCESINTITLPETIKQIGEWAFSDCENLERIDIKEGVQNIGDLAFDRCISLQSITLPSTIERIGQMVFKGVKSIVSLTNEFTVMGGCLYSKDMKTLIYFFQNGRSFLEIPHGVEIVGENAFEGSCIREVILPTSLKEIRDCAFAHCEKLQEIDIPQSVIEIGARCFCECTSLVSIQLPDTISVIKVQLFEGCKNLSRIHIPNNVREIQIHSFFDTGITRVTLPRNLEKLYGNSFGYSPITEISSNSDHFIIKDKTIYGDSGKTLVLYYGEDKKFIVPDGVEKISDFAFSYAYSIQEFILPTSIKQIGREILSDTLPKKILVPASLISMVKESLPNYYADNIFELNNDCD